MPEADAHAEEVFEPCVDIVLGDQALGKRRGTVRLDEAAAVYIRAGVQHVRHRLLRRGGVMVRREHVRVSVTVGRNVPVKLPLVSSHRLQQPGVGA